MNIILDTDSYKASHYLQYPPGTTAMFSYLESRGGRYPYVVFFGLQYYLKKYLSQPVTPEMVEEAREFLQVRCLVREGKLYKRYDAKKGRTPPPGFEPAQDPDPVTGRHPGWLPVGDGPEDRWFREAYRRPLPDGTYELCGPRIQGNPEGFETHVLVPHGIQEVEAPRTYAELKEFMRDFPYEGIVWRHPDGRMVKIKKRDFGYKR